MIITLPWPHKHLSPNARVHWSQKAKAVKAARHAVVWPVSAAIAGGGGPYAIFYTFHPADKRRRDLDNLIATTKATTDGIADALRVNDSTFILSYAMGDVCKPACVRVSISE